MACKHDFTDFGIQPVDLGKEFTPRHSGHPVITDNHVYRIFSKYFQSLGG